jgi:hypothetical protein
VEEGILLGGRTSGRGPRQDRLFDWNLLVMEEIGFAWGKETVFWGPMAEKFSSLRECRGPQNGNPSFGGQISA